MTFLRDEMVRSEMHQEFYDAAYESGVAWYEIVVWFFGG